MEALNIANSTSYTFVEPFGNWMKEKEEEKDRTTNDVNALMDVMNVPLPI